MNGENVTVLARSDIHRRESVALVRSLKPRLVTLGHVRRQRVCSGLTWPPRHPSWQHFLRGEAGRWTVNLMSGAARLALCTHAGRAADCVAARGNAAPLLLPPPRHSLGEGRQTVSL